MFNKKRFNKKGIIILLIWIIYIFSKSFSFAGEDEWTSIGPVGGYVSAIAVHPSSEDTIFASVDSKLYKTDNGGDSWMKLNVGKWEYSNINHIVIDHNDPHVIYVGASWELFKTVDGGVNWTQIASFVVNSLALDANNPGRIYVGSSRGKVYKSDDSGFTWVELNIGTVSIGIISALVVNPDDPAIIYAGTCGDIDWHGEGIFKTIDGGKCWKNIWPQHINVTALRIDQFHPQVIYAATSPEGVFKSIDSGNSWESSNSGLWDGSISSMEINHVHSEVVYVGTYDNGLFRSVDGGLKWVQLNKDLDGMTIRSISLCSANASLIFIGGSSGVFKSYNEGEDWVLIGTEPVDILTVALDPWNSTILYAGGDRGINKSSDCGRNWMPKGRLRENKWTTSITVDLTTPKTLYAGSYAPDGAVFISIDAGATWIKTGLVDVAINDIALDPSDSKVIYAGGLADPFVGGMFKSVDAGSTWTIINNFIIHTIAIDPLHPAILYAGTALEGIYKSIDAGFNWNAISDGLPEPRGYILSIAIDPVQTNILYCGVSDTGIYKSVDGGVHWDNSSIGLSNLDVIVIAIDPVNTNILYAGTYGNGVFRSLNRGQTWNEINSGWTEACISSLCLDPNNSRVIYAGCYNNSIWRYISSYSPIRKVIDESRHEQFSLSQNYPNPFNCQTTISYFLPQSAFVTLEIHNLLGQNVRTLIAESKPAGLFEIFWYGTDDFQQTVACGMYLFNLRINKSQKENIIHIKKLLFLK